jgi:hypothetical protein
MSQMMLERPLMNFSYHVSCASILQSLVLSVRQPINYAFLILNFKMSSTPVLNHFPSSSGEGQGTMAKLDTKNSFDFSVGILSFLVQTSGLSEELVDKEAPRLKFTFLFQKFCRPPRVGISPVVLGVRYEQESLTPETMKLKLESHGVSSIPSGRRCLKPTIVRDKARTNLSLRTQVPTWTGECLHGGDTYVFFFSQYQTCITTALFSSLLD